MQDNTSMIRDTLRALLHQLDTGEAYIFSMNKEYDMTDRVKVTIDFYMKENDYIPWWKLKENGGTIE